MVKYINAGDNLIGDLIPVDLVSDMIIVAAAIYANKGEFTVMHSGSSCRNPVHWGLTRVILLSLEFKI